MHQSIPLVRGLAAAVLLAGVMLPAPPAAANGREGAACAPMPSAKPARGKGFRAVLAAARRAGAGELAVAGAFGDGRAGQAAGAVAEAVIDGGDPTRAAIAGAAGPGRTAQAAVVVADAAVDLARQASPDCGASR